MQFGPQPQSFARRLNPEMEPLVPSSRPSIQGSVACLDYLTTARLTKNHRIIQDIATEMEVTFDTYMLSEIFAANTWNTKNAGMLNLVLHGVISLDDKRVQLSPELIQTEGVTNSLL